MEYTLIDSKKETESIRHEMAAEAYRQFVLANSEYERTMRIAKLKGPQFAQTRAEARENLDELAKAAEEAKVRVDARIELPQNERDDTKKSVYTVWIRDLERQHLRASEERRTVKGDPRHRLDINIAIIEDTLAYAKKELAKL